MTFIIRKLQYCFEVIGKPISQQASSKSKRLYQEKIVEIASKAVVSSIDPIKR